MRVLLSIRPEHVANIFQGTKIFEYRRKIFKRSDVDTVVVYATKPFGKIVGEFMIDEIFECEPANIWLKTRHGAGISKEYFDSYFKGRSKAYAIKIGDLKIYESPISPRDLIADFTPPQSYMYIKDQHQAGGAIERQIEMAV